MEIPLVALVDRLAPETRRESVSLLALLDLLAAFDTNHGVLLDWLARLGFGGTVLQ